MPNSQQALINFRNYMVKLCCSAAEDTKDIIFRPGVSKLDLCWLLALSKAEKKDLYEEKCTLHGLWPLIRMLLTPRELRMYGRQLCGKQDTFDELFEKHGDFITSHWSNMRETKSIEATQQLIMYEWSKHGKPNGIPLVQYIYDAICLKSTIPIDFGLPVGVPITLGEAAQRTRSVMQRLELFGEPIGADVVPEIVTTRTGAGVFHITDIRPHFYRYAAADGEIKFRAVDVPDTDMDCV